MSLGEVLGMSLAQVRMLPASEITLWVAYFKIKNEKPIEKELSPLEKFRKDTGV